MTKKTNVVVLGGGYAGVIAANHLRVNADIAITLINPRPQFVERIRLHQLVAGSDDAVVDYADVLADDVSLIIDTAERIDATARAVTLASGGTVGYDYLVYAVGSTGAALTVPGAAEFAYPISDLEHAGRLRAAMAEVHPSAPVTVVGAGPTGIETAAELAEQGRAVTLVCGGVLGPYLSEPGRRSVAKRMKKLGVTVVDGPDAKVAEVRMDSVVLADGRELPSVVTIWTAGFGVPDLATRSGLATDAIGRLLTDETLTSIDNPYIVAAGDSAAPSDAPLRMSCQAAIPLGAQAANTVLSRIEGTAPAALNQAFTGQCISLGRKAGTIQLAHTDDSARPLYVGGRAAASIKEIICKGTIWGLAREARKPGSYIWLKGGKRAEHLAAAATRAALPAASENCRMTGTTSGSDEHAERFTLLRPLLFTIAYEIIGTATESDDVLQESYLRWAEVDLSAVQDTKAYLAQLVTRQALNTLRAQARRREEYVGPWLPEPLLLDTTDASSDVVLAESVSMAMMVVLESLTPDERAVFVLREVFGFSHDEIASTIGKSAAAVRQLAHRAREHVQARRKRFELDPKRSLEVTAQFFAAAATGDIDGLISMLAPDAVWTADSDGKASAARRPVVGAERVARVILGLLRAAGEAGRVEPAFYNGAPAFVLYLGDNLEGVVTVEIIDGKISHFYAMRNPEKLVGVKVAREISRLA